MDEIMHPQYRLRHVLNAASEQFAREKSIQLCRFLLPEMFQKTINALQGAALRVASIPDRYHHHVFSRLPPIASRLERFLHSKQCAGVVSSIVQEKVGCKSAEWRVYAHRDYSLLHDKNKEPCGYDVILDLSQKWNVRACGHHSYVRNGEELVRVVPSPNTLAIVFRPAGVLRFVKYVNHLAGSDKRFVLQARFA